MGIFEIQKVTDPLNRAQKLLGGLLVTVLTSAVGSHSANAQNFTFASLINPGSLIQGTSTITFTNGGDGVIGAPTDIVLANLMEFTTTGTGPNTFSSVAYNDTITLTDAFTGTSQMGSISEAISGQADGGVGGNAPSALFTNMATSSSVLTFSFADGTYTVTQTSFVSPGPNDGKASGSLGATVTFSPAATPEPSAAASLAIGAVGLTALVIGRRRKTLTPA